ncbi:MAG: SPASM domain-containing protein, partial [Desulfobacterales bacterium]|nr:SPASM domain-containing protein [Desulfobacterales bacterium]
MSLCETISGLQRKHQPADRRIVNGIQTNGTLLDEEWCRFLAAEGFGVGISLDGPEHLHDIHRRTKGGEPTHRRAMNGYELLRKHRIPHDVLCVVHEENVHHPSEVYRFFKQIRASYISFLPLVEARQDQDGSVSPRTVLPEPFGAFLCTIFDEWMAQDIGRLKIQIFEEAAATALGQNHSLCIFKKTCGDVPVLEHNGDFFSCDHFVDEAHYLGNIRETPLVDLIGDPRQAAFGRAKWDTLPRYCRECEVLSLCNGGCPKDRILLTSDGEAGLNYLCAGYK